MSNHITFYRKYRSQTFSELEGQEHIIQTLSNALQFQRLSHAYIFSGPRGTGKTSTARILAKALNCRKGMSFTPCLECDVCEKIALGQCVDVLEIDAASNTGVDNIRTLNEQVNFSPVEGRYKVYIIDEVHMLSTGAFNALLKTLEEPPTYTVFILATTESHKIPATIHSRCQHLHFRKLTSQELVSQLKKIAQSEEISVSDAALFRISRQAGGCMRDAVSLFDQVFSFKGATITEDDVVLLLGGSHFDHSFSLIKAYFQGNITDIVSQLKQFFLQGGNVIQLVSDIAEIVKQLMYVQLKLESEIDIDQARLSELTPVSGSMPFAKLSELLENLAKLEMELRWFPNPELLLEVRLLNWMTPSKEIKQHITSSQQAVQSKPGASTTAAASPSIASPTSRPQAKVAPMPQNLSSVPSVNTVPQAPSTHGNLSADIPAKWTEFLLQLKAKRQPLFSILDKSVVSDIQNGQVLVRLKQDFKFFRDKLKEEAHQLLIKQLLTEIFRTPLTLGFASESDPVPVAATALPSPTQHPTNPAEPVKVVHTAIQATSVNIPAQSQKINEIVALFEGKIVSSN